MFNVRYTLTVLTLMLMRIVPPLTWNYYNLIFEAAQIQVRGSASSIQRPTTPVLPKLFFFFLTIATHGPSHRETRSAVSHTGRCVRILSLSAKNVCVLTPIG